MTPESKFYDLVLEEVSEAPGHGLATYSRGRLRECLKYGPDHQIVLAWQELGHHGLSPFALAGISGTSPKRVMRRLENTQPKLSLGLCETTLLPVLCPTWSGTTFKNFYSDDLRSWAERECGFEEGDYYVGAEAEVERTMSPHQLPKMLQLYGGKNWRLHCTRSFNPFGQEVVPISLPLWKALKKLWHAAAALQEDAS